ncbi:hypothetical protein ACMYR3_07265 [Ampullimonas aquatilis]|uniref:hypothetical protein n=1 Tax=Ampullimonas aquatilis TaxID=1341549 RepID=UPI003C746B5C
MSSMIRKAGCKTTGEVIDYFLLRFVLVPINFDLKNKMTAMLTNDLGTEDLAKADTYMEDALRNALHVILALPAYQLN